MKSLQLKELNSRGYEVILVTSGAVGVGRQRLRYRKVANSRSLLFLFSSNTCKHRIEIGLFQMEVITIELSSELKFEGDTSTAIHTK